MLTFLARYPKQIAWILFGLIYLELLLVPLTSQALPAIAVSRKAVPATLRFINPGGNRPLAANGLPVAKAPDYRKAPAGANVLINEGKEGMVPPAIESIETGGPTQPEMQAFSSVNNSNMVDLFSGDFSYNIPLMDVGGYPITLGYRAGVSMDQEASWVGLGWNINPGTISRNLRGLPDDFSGDSIRKVLNIRENKTVGVTAGADMEIAGFPKGTPKEAKDDSLLKATGIGIGASLGITHNNYKGWSLEQAINASINSGGGASTPLTAGLGLSIRNSSADGLTLVPSASLSVKVAQYKADEHSGSSLSFSISAPYNSRYGLKTLQVGLGASQYKETEKNSKEDKKDFSTGWQSSIINFFSPTFTPSITVPMSSSQFSFTGKVGFEKKVYHPSFFVSGYVSKQKIEASDTLRALPSFGYLHYQDGNQNQGALLDFNREKELPYREKPAMPHIAIPMYTYDAFSITGEGTGGMFRAYRNDIGFVYDHFMKTKDKSDNASLDFGIGDMVHVGLDVSITRAISQSGPWLEHNALRHIIDWRKDNGFFQSVYFRNPGEKTINDKNFYKTIGDDDLVTVDLYQAGPSSSILQATNYLARYRNGILAGKTQLTQQNAVKQERDKRTQVISYLTAKEASAAAMNKYIENYTVNVFNQGICGDVNTDENELGTGIPSYYYNNRTASGEPGYTILEPTITWTDTKPWSPAPGINENEFSVRWKGRLRAPVTGTYRFTSHTDDGFYLRINDYEVIDDWRDRSLRNPAFEGKTVNLVAGEFYDFEALFYDWKNDAEVKLYWEYPGHGKESIARAFLYPPAVDTFRVPAKMEEPLQIVKEKRVNTFRKDHHISEVTVLNNDGRRYVYGVPVYNLKQKETTFAVDSRNGKGNRETGLVQYNHGTDNTTKNQNGKDWYYSSEEVPAYAHSFLLTGILSADYSDITGNGISDDDIGDAVKFNYSKVRGIKNPFGWRAPTESGTATFNEGLRTDYRDDKGNYIYGEKELWYLHSIESKTMVATFVLETRDDLPSYNEKGERVFDGAAKRLKEINLYSKSDFARNRTSATPIKTVHFEYGYDLCTNVNGTAGGKLTLKKVWFTYNNNNKTNLNPYIFHYHNTNPSYNIKSYDRWGSYKDPLQNPGSTAGNIITNADYPYSLQDSTQAAKNAGAWALDSIYLPSGGSIKVQYESDDYAYVQNKRAMQLCKVISLNNNPSILSGPASLYRASSDLTEDYRYVCIRVPKPVSNLQEVYTQYLEGIKKFYFRLYVQMPTDLYNNGNTHEYVSCYAEIEPSGGYGIINATTIWVKLKGIELTGDGPGVYSPLVKATTQFLRLNLPSKAYKNSETGDNLDLETAITMLVGMADNITDAFKSFDRIAREENMGRYIDTTRSFVRLTNPYFKKYGGGHRVKRITIYDNWDKMTNQRAAVYGQDYIYTTKKEINGKPTSISSGVASYEPGIGGDENPFREPIEYIEKISALGPITLGYSEEPLGESFFPSPGVGYSSMRVRTIHYKGKKSANGYDETNFYTAYDFPTYTDRTLIDDTTKKRFKPSLANFLRVDARHFIAISQGFKVELNDMHGKLRSKASYPETDPDKYTSYTENIYKVEDPQATYKRLSNKVMVMKPDGTIDSAALIGKDMELMMDMREQQTITNGYNVPINTDMFTIPFLPGIWLLPTLLNFAQREENRFRSVATTKIIQRFGVLDSVIQIDKGSKISTKDILYDSETGDVLMTRTQNEFNDPVFNFTYPSHWAYDGMGAAYKNIGVTLDKVNIRNGRIENATPAMNSLFTSGDEILVAGKQKTGTGTGECGPDIATFPNYNKIWCIDSSVLGKGSKAIYFIERNGQPYTGLDVSMKVIRSGRRNVFGAIGSVTGLDSFLRKNTTTGEYELKINTASRIIAASGNEFRQIWKVEDVLAKKPTLNCLPIWRATGNLRCVKDANGNNTGYEEAEEADVNPNSGSKDSTRWTSTGLNCARCPRPANWVQTGVFECVKDPQGENTGLIRREEKNLNGCDTGTDKRWVVQLDCQACGRNVDSVTICTINNEVPGYSSCGGYIASADYQSFSRIVNNNFWYNVNGFNNGACSSTPAPENLLMSGEPAIVQKRSESNGDSTFTAAKSIGMQASLVTNPDSLGPLIRSGIWACGAPDGQGNFLPLHHWIGITDTLHIPSTGTYYMGFAGDNEIRIFIDGRLISQKLQVVEENFEIWYIYPISLTNGDHSIRIEARNDAGPALFGVEIYNNTETQIRNARCYSGCSNSLNLIFTTKALIGRKYRYCK